MWFVYVLECEDGSLRKPGFRKLSLYTGISNNVEKRFLDHQNGKGGHYTKSHKPVKIVYKEELKTLSEALKRESQIKSWNRENKIRTLLLKTSR